VEGVGEVAARLLGFSAVVMMWGLSGVTSPTVSRRMSPMRRPVLRATERRVPPGKKGIVI